MEHAALYDTPITLIDGTETTFGRFRGQAVLVVNVASKCGFTPQYAGLEELYQKYSDEGLVVLGLPCNQFLGQEPGSEGDIADFCEVNFGVTFPLTAKVNVRGKNRHPLYAELTKFPVDKPAKVKWNFEKFLVNASGNVVDRFTSNVEPGSDELVAAIERTLAEQAA